MISLMRKMINNNVYKIFLWIFLFMMAFGSGVAIFNFGERQDWVIKAYQEKMTQQKFNTMLRLAKQQQEMFRQKGFAMALPDVKQETVRGGVVSLLSQHVMDHVGMVMPKSYIDSQMQQILQQLPPFFFKPNGELDEAVFNQRLAPNTIEDFIADVELEGKNKLLFGLVDAGVYVPAFELVLQYNAEFANKTYEYITLPYQKYLTQVRSHNAPSNEALNRFYKKTAIAEKFKTLERRSGKVWSFNATNFAAPVSDSEARLFYDKQKMQRYVLESSQMQVRTLLIKIEPGKEAEAKSKIEEIHQEAVKNPKEFESLVRKFSEDVKSAARGGLSDFFTKDDKKLDKMVVETTFEFLTTDGQISAPLKTSHGFELVQRIAKNPAKYKEFKSVESEIKKELSADKFKKRFAQDAARVISGAKYNPESLEKFIERYKGVVSELPLDVQKPGMDFTQLFKTEEGRYSQFFDKDAGLILHCSKVEKSKLPDIEEVKAKVLSLYFEKEALDLMKKQLELALKDAKSMSLQEVARKYETSIQSATFSNKNGKIEQSSILKDSEMQVAVKTLQHQGALAIVETKVDGFLIKLVQLEACGQADLSEQKDHLKKVMFYTKLYQIKDGFIASLYRTAKLNNKIEIKNELLQITKEV